MTPVTSKLSIREAGPGRMGRDGTIARIATLSSRQLLGNAVQSMIMMPFDARELRQKLDELDLGFQVEGVRGKGW